MSTEDRAARYVIIFAILYFAGQIIRSWSNQ